MEGDCRTPGGGGQDEAGEKGRSDEAERDVLDDDAAVPPTNPADRLPNLAYHHVLR
jgi:hypothetical protein